MKTLDNDEPIFDEELATYDSHDFRVHPSASIYKQIDNIIYFHDIKSENGKSLFRKRTFDMKTKQLDDKSNGWMNPVKHHQKCDQGEMMAD